MSNELNQPARSGNVVGSDGTFNNLNEIDSHIDVYERI